MSVCVCVWGGGVREGGQGTVSAGVSVRVDRGQ